MATWPVGVFQDDGIYTVLAKALATGHGFRYLNIPGLPHATHYPPAYPAFLALLWQFAPRFPSNVAVFTFANAVFLALAAAGTFHSFARTRAAISGAGAAVVCLAAGGAAPPLIFGVFVLSEPMFMALLLPALLLAERAADGGRARDAFGDGPRAPAPRHGADAGRLLIPALVMVLVGRRHWRGAALALPARRAFSCRGNCGRAHRPRRCRRCWSASTGPTGVACRCGAKRRDPVPGPRGGDEPPRSSTTWRGSVLGGGSRGAGPAPGLRSRLVGAPGSPGSASSLRAADAGTLLFIDAVPVAGARLAVRPHAVRVGDPSAVRDPPARQRRHGRWVHGTRAAGRSAAPPGPAALLACGFAVYNVRGVRQRWWDTIPRANTERATPLVAWARTHTAPDDVLATDDDALLNLYTGRRAVPVGTFTPQEYLRAQTYAFAAPARADHRALPAALRPVLDQLRRHGGPRAGASRPRAHAHRGRVDARRRLRKDAGVSAPRAASDPWGGVGQPAPVPGAITGPVGAPAPVGSAAATPRVTAWNAEDARRDSRSSSRSCSSPSCCWWPSSPSRHGRSACSRTTPSTPCWRRRWPPVRGTASINLPGAPHATHYPPGYPLVLAMLWRLAPRFP